MLLERGSLPGEVQKNLRGPSWQQWSRCLATSCSSGLPPEVTPWSPADGITPPCIWRTCGSRALLRLSASLPSPTKGILALAPSIFPATSNPALPGAAFQAHLVCLCPSLLQLPRAQKPAGLGLLQEAGLGGPSFGLVQAFPLGAQH